MKLNSLFAERFGRSSGISELMDDLGDALANPHPDICMLGGGNPAMIPELNRLFIDEIEDLIKTNGINHALGYYSTPQGNQAFLQALADYFNQRYAWNITADNIALTNGSQQSFFYLFNLLAGEMVDGQHKKILLPLAPEYIGYRDQGLSDDMFVSCKPTIDMMENQQFKYRINFDALTIDDSIAAICVSRPTNPTGNVITDDELKQLDELARLHHIPLIIDNAYGQPFPGAIYTDVNFSWNSNMILGLSLSKLGLPGVRTGIIIACKEVIDAISKLNGIICLAPNNMGACIMTQLLKAQKIDAVCDNIVRPYYQQKLQQAEQLFKRYFSDLPVAYHKPEGAFFLWLWFKDLKITSKELYQNLKQQHVYIIPGEDFFIGLETDWPHQSQCIRINYASPEEQLERGLKIIAEEIKKYL